jgi:hypothetical protein
MVGSIVMFLFDGSIVYFVLFFLCALVLLIVIFTQTRARKNPTRFS